MQRASRPSADEARGHFRRIPAPLGRAAFRRSGRCSILDDALHRLRAERLLSGENRSRRGRRDFFSSLRKVTNGAMEIEGAAATPGGESSRSLHMIRRATSSPYPDRICDVLELLRPEIGEARPQRTVQARVDGIGDRKSARCSKGFHPGGDVHAVAVDVTILESDIADMNPIRSRIGASAVKLS